MSSTLKLAIDAEREACARMLELRDSELLLMAGEMTAQELRTVKAVLAQRAKAIRMRANATGEVRQDFLSQALNEGDGVYRP